MSYPFDRYFVLESKSEVYWNKLRFLVMGVEDASFVGP